MAFLAELLLFLVPFLAYLGWRRLNPGVEPAPHLLLAAAVGVALAIGGLVWFGLSRSLEAGTYVPPRLENGQLIPGHTERPNPAP